MKTKLTPRHRANLEAIAQAQAAFERAYTRMRRSINKMEQSRKTIVRCKRNIANELALLTKQKPPA